MSFSRVKEFEGRDGKQYKLSTLPFTEATLELIDKIDSTGGEGLEGARALLRAFKVSLRRNYSEEEVEQLLEDEVIPIRANSEEEQNTAAAMVQWMFAGK